MSQPGFDSTDALDQIAIVGMAGRFPGASDIETFWRNLESGREGISVLSADDLAASRVPPDVSGRDDYVPAKGLLDGADMFDAGFFGYSPREAEILDPQHRVFLECAWSALESAGCVPNRFDGRIGVFAGAGINTYLLNNLLANRRVFDSVGMYQALLASDKDFLATRAAYKLGLRGPAITVQTACSTSLVAVHLACQSLLSGECDIALAGGVAVTSPVADGYRYEPGGIMSADGHCRPFDARAGGTVPGNGVGVVVLRRLSHALDAGDAIEAVIRGTAVNNDGSLKAGFTAPSVDGQAEVITEALDVAGVSADTIGYVETHGTATALGDPIEVTALTRVFREHTDGTGVCAIGSVKSNVGHLDAAAGVTGLIKAVLAVKHGTVPPTLHFTEPNPDLRLADSPFFVTNTPQPWPRTGEPRRAGVSSFGIGGTNAHVVLEQAPDRPGAGPPRPVVLLPLSGRTPDAVIANARGLTDALVDHPDVELADVADTLARRRTAFDHRATVVCRDPHDAVTALKRLRPSDVVTTDDRTSRVAFLFPGQGSQYVGMAGDLYRHEPVFAHEVDHCAELLAPHVGRDLRTLLFAASADPAEAADASSALEQTRLTQPSLFLIEYALARLWMSWGVRPHVMVGHSVGEYVAACLAGVFDLPDAARLVAARGRLVQAMPGGSMLTVCLPEAETAGWLDGDLTLAAVNSTDLSVVSGPTAAVDGLERRLRDAGVAVRRLHTSHAFHSPSMDDAVEPLVGQVRTVPLGPPRIPFCSNVTGTWITDDEATDPRYWGRHLREPVRFSSAAEVLLQDPGLALLEVGPGHTLTDLVRAHRAWRGDRATVTSVRHPQQTVDDRDHLLRGLGTLWSAGVRVDWAAVGGGAERRPVRLPTYAFQRQRYWVEPENGARQEGSPAPVDETVTADRIHVPGWRRLPPAARRVPPTDAAWLVLADGELGRLLAWRLEIAGARVVRVRSGSHLDNGGDGTWICDPTSREHLTHLLKQLSADNPAGIRIVHLLGLDGKPPVPSGGALDLERLRRARVLGFDSLLALAQSIDDMNPGVPVEVTVVSRGLYSVTGDETLQPENATVAGVVTVAPQEVANLSCRTLDVTGADASEETADAVFDLLTQDVDESDLALRGRHWWFRVFDPTPLPQRHGDIMRLRDRGTYLITGGLGGIGLALAEQIAEGCDQPVLALLGRSPFPADREWSEWLTTHDHSDSTSARIRRLLRIRDLGAQVVVYQADVTDESAVAACVTDLHTRFGRLTGVVHAAGVPSTGMIARKTIADAEAVTAAKTIGTLALDRVCAGDDLDFLVLCSSVAAVLGGPGQSDYGAANAFMDTFAHWRRRTGAPVTSIAWGTWDGVGMAAGVGERPADGRRQAGDGRASSERSLLRLVRESDSGRTYETTISTATDWIVDDHRLMGHGLVPGTAYLELVWAALTGAPGDTIIELHDVLFPTPAVVPDGQTRTLYITVEDQAERWRFAVRSRAADGTWREHAVGTASHAPREETPPRDLAEVRAEVTPTEVVEDEADILLRARADRYSDGPLEFRVGPRWQVLRRIEIGAGRMLATLALDEAFREDLREHPLHPAVMDMAVGIFRLDARDPYYLPLSYRSMRVLRPLTPTVHCVVRIADHDGSTDETLTCDLDLLDPDGATLVQITGYTVKRINDVPALMEAVRRSVTDEVAAGRPRTGLLGTLTRGMSEADGRAAFARILSAADLPEYVVVTATAFPTMVEAARAITPERLALELADLAPPTGSHPRPDLDTPYVAPATPEEHTVAELWQETLGVERVGVNDDFFALGGHSLAAVQISSKLQVRLGVEIDLRGFFNTPTVAHLAQAVAAAAGGDAPTTDAIEAVSGDPDELMAQLDELSDDEVEEQLRALLDEEGNE